MLPSNTPTERASALSASGLVRWSRKLPRVHMTGAPGAAAAVVAVAVAAAVAVAEAVVAGVAEAAAGSSREEAPRGYAALRSRIHTAEARCTRVGALMPEAGVPAG